MTKALFCVIIKAQKRKGEIKMTERFQELVDRLVDLYGWDNQITIGFLQWIAQCDECDFNYNLARIMVEAHEADPQK